MAVVRVSTEPCATHPPVCDLCGCPIDEPTDDERARWAALDESVKERDRLAHAGLCAGVEAAHTGVPMSGPSRRDIERWLDGLDPDDVPDVTEAYAILVALASGTATERDRRRWAQVPAETRRGLVGPADTGDTPSE